MLCVGDSFVGAGGLGGYLKNTRKARLRVRRKAERAVMVPTNVATVTDAVNAKSLTTTGQGRT